MKNSTIAIRIDEAEKARITAIAAKRDIPVSQLIREAIRQYLLEGGNDNSTKSENIASI